MNHYPFPPCVVQGCEAHGVYYATKFYDKVVIVNGHRSNRISWLFLCTRHKDEHIKPDDPSYTVKPTGYEHRRQYAKTGKNKGTRHRSISYYYIPGSKSKTGRTRKRGRGTLVQNPRLRGEAGTTASGVQV